MVTLGFEYQGPDPGHCSIDGRHKETDVREALQRLDPLNGTSPGRAGVHCTVARLISGQTSVDLRSRIEGLADRPGVSLFRWRNVGDRHIRRREDRRRREVVQRACIVILAPDN